MCWLVLQDRHRAAHGTDFNAGMCPADVLAVWWLAWALVVAAGFLATMAMDGTLGWFGVPVLVGLVVLLGGSSCGPPLVGVVRRPPEGRRARTTALLGDPCVLIRPDGGPSQLSTPLCLRARTGANVTPGMTSRPAPAGEAGGLSSGLDREA
jgi:hypothetical protein